MAGCDLANVQGIISGSERIHAATIRRFIERFARFNLPGTALVPSYGLAEATLYVTSLAPERPPATAWFDYEKLSAGHAKRCSSGGGVEGGALREVVDLEAAGESWRDHDGVGGCTPYGWEETLFSDQARHLVMLELVAE